MGLANPMAESKKRTMREGEMDMWTCPKCGRQFERQNQGHYCRNAPTDAEAYVAQQNEAHRERLDELVNLLRSVVPDANETIKWNMPRFQSGTHSLQFAACKKWISLYIGADMIERFRDHLEGQGSKKDALYLPYDKPVPWETIRQMIKQYFLEEQRQ